MKLEYATIREYAAKTFGIEPEEFDRKRFEDMVESLLEGKPVDTGASDAETVLLRTLLEKEGVYVDSDGYDTDFGGSVYWSRDMSTVVVVF